jgi:thioredoxin-like negative regulator of GroEL
LALQQISEDDWLRLKRIGGGQDALFFASPFCGTCKVAERMLDVVQAIGVPVTLYKLNINEAVKLRSDWRITSVPCIVIIKNGEPERIEYAMRSVEHLLQLLKEEGTT